MLEEFEKSIKSILYERMTSPLYGTFIVAWLIWNWEIPYLTLFVDVDTIEYDKITYIKLFLIDWGHTVIFPLISTLVLLVVVPFAAVAAYFLHLRFDRWKHDLKIKVEKAECLTIEQSNRLRSELEELSKNYANLLEEKQTIDGYLRAARSKIETLEGQAKEEWRAELPQLGLKPQMKFFKMVAEYAQTGRNLNSELDGETISWFITQEIIELIDIGKYRLTPKGKFFSKELTNAQ